MSKANSKHPKVRGAVPASPAGVYRWRPGSRFSRVKAAVAGQELERIREQYGSLTPAAVVEAAADESSPLHPAFEWDDAIAASEHRLQQARQLIRSVQVVYVEGGQPGPVYVHVVSEDGPSYQSVEVAVEDQDLLSAALGGLHAKVASARRAVSDLRVAAMQLGAGANLAAVDQVDEHLNAAQGAAARIR